MIPAIPPLNITVSGNRCGGCCRSSEIREPISKNVVIYSQNKFVQISARSLSDKKAQAEAFTVFSEIKSYLRHSYSVDLEDLPFPARPLDLTKPPSVEQVRLMESAAMGYCEAVKKTKQSSESITSPLMKKSDSSKESGL